MVGTDPLSKAIGVDASQLIRFSAEQTGTGSAQNIAHGLSYIPKLTVVIDQGGTVLVAVTYGTNTITNIVVTVTSGTKFRILYA